MSIPGAVDSILQTIGQTPLVRLQRSVKDITSEIYVKCEYFNPGGSTKDRIAIHMIKKALADGRLRQGGTIIEATSGNTGMGLALVAAVHQFQCIFVMPDKVSTEKQQALKAFGAQVITCPTDVQPEDLRSYYQVSQHLAKTTPNSFYSNQYHNPDNPEAHYLSTGPELWQQTQGQFDVFCAGMGTGGTLSGVGRYLKEQNPQMLLLGVDPIGSLYHGYKKTGKLGEAHTYLVEGIGEDFLPSTMDLDILDEVLQVSDAESFRWARTLIAQEGILAGGSSGAAVAGAVKYASQLKKPLRIVVHLPDTAGRYLSKYLDEQWLKKNGLASLLKP